MPKKKYDKKGNNKNSPFRIRIRGRDNTPLTSSDLQQGLLEAVRRLKQHPDTRYKWVTISTEPINVDGKTVWPPSEPGEEKGTWEIYPYRTAASDFDA